MMMLVSCHLPQVQPKLLHLLRPLRRLLVGNAQQLLTVHRPIPHVRLELSAPLVQGYSVAESANDVVRSREREAAGNDADGIDSIPIATRDRVRLA